MPWVITPPLTEVGLGPPGNPLTSLGLLMHHIPFALLYRHLRLSSTMSKGPRHPHKVKRPLTWPGNPALPTRASGRAIGPEPRIIITKNRNVEKPLLGLSLGTWDHPLSSSGHDCYHGAQLVELVDLEHVPTYSQPNFLPQAA